MKLKIKIKVLTNGCVPVSLSKGDWIDLRAAKQITEIKPPVSDLKNGVVRFNYLMVPLGVAMQLPKGFEAYIVARSSLFKNKGFVVANSIGIIDNSYCGDTDEWKLPVIAFEPMHIDIGERLAQFRIQLSQKASFTAKLKWLFYSGIKFIIVDDLENKDRGGFGSTGTK